MKLLTRQEAAKFLRIGTRTFDRLVAEGELVGARIGGRRLVFDEGRLDAYVLKKMRQAAQ